MLGKQKAEREDQACENGDRLKAFHGFYGSCFASFQMPQIFHRTHLHTQFPHQVTLGFNSSCINLYDARGDYVLQCSSTEPGQLQRGLPLWQTQKGDEPRGPPGAQNKSWWLEPPHQAATAKRQLCTPQNAALVQGCLSSFIWIKNPQDKAQLLSPACSPHTLIEKGLINLFRALCRICIRNRSRRGCSWITYVVLSFCRVPRVPAATHLRQG